MDTLRQDISLALRGLVRNPWFAAAVVLTMALGIGANTAIFSVVHAVLLRDLPYAHGERMMILRQQRPRINVPNQNFSAKEIDDYRTMAGSLDEVVEFHSMWFILLGRGEPERVQTGVVSHNFFESFGIKPVLGRTFRADDDKPGADAVLVLSHGYWQSRFGGDASVVGQVFEMNDRPHTVVGVLPPIPQYPQENDVYMPVSACPFRSAQATIDNRNARLVQAFGRLKSGVPVDQANTDLGVVASRLQQAYPDVYPATTGYTAVALPLRDELARGFKPTLLVLVGAAGFVLLIVAASVANLLLARMVRREREMAIRSALGAGRWRLFRQLVTESVVLSLIGALVGLALASISLDLLVAFADRFTTRSTEIGINSSVLAFTLAVAAGTGLLVGVLPALPGRMNLSATIQAGARAVGAGRMRFRSTLIVAQVAVSFVLLIGAGLMLRSLMQLQAVDAGIQTDSVQTMRVALNFTKYSPSEPERIRQFHKTLIERLKQIPGVRSVGAASTFPLTGSSGFVTGLRVEGQGEVEAARLPRAEISTASPGYFQTVGIPLLSGRVFTEHDRADSTSVAVVSQSMATRFFGDRDPVGARISSNNGQTWTTIVGVAGNTRRSLDAAPSDAVYVPLDQASPLTALFLMRTTGPVSADLPRQAREALYSIDPNQPADQFRTLEEVRSQSVEAPRLTAILIGLFAGLAVLITAAGLGGVIAFSVNQRTQEFGVRMALGATPSSLLGMVLKQALTLVAMGLAIGLVGALVSGRTLRTLLFNVTPTDVLTYVAVSIAFLAVAVIACALPARRAAAVDPMIALRGN
jgi:putative ABC transport system permease protein